MINRGNKKQSVYVYVHERAKKIVEGIVDKFCLFFSSVQFSWNNGDRHKIYEIFLINCFVFVIILVWQTVHSWAMTQITANLTEKNIATNCSQVTVLAADFLTKKHFGHYALLKFFPSDHQADNHSHIENIEHWDCSMCATSILKLYPTKMIIYPFSFTRKHLLITLWNQTRSGWVTECGSCKGRPKVARGLLPFKPSNTQTPNLGAKYFCGIQRV